MVDGVFVGLSILTVGSAIISLESREILYGGIALAVSLLGIAGYFIILDAPFVAMFQIAVYVGAVAVLIIFTVMLVRSPNTVTKRETKRRKIAGILLSLGFLALVGTIIGNSVVTQFSFGNSAPVIDIKEIGKELLTYYSPVLIVLALTLAGSIIGALALARREDIEEKMNQPSDFLIIAVILISIGIYGLVVKRNALRLIFSIELIANAVNLILVAFSTMVSNPQGQIFVLFAIAISAAEVAVGLGIIIIAYRFYKDIDITEYKNLKN